MYKLESLQDLLKRCLPKQFKENPQNLIVQVVDGRVVAGFGDNLSFEYRYSVQITVCDWPKNVHVDAIFVPLIAWLMVHQSDLLDNNTKRDNALQFWVNPLTPDSSDLGIDIPLRETVIVKEDPKHATRFICEHKKEPCHGSTPCIAEHWELWLEEDKLGEWDIPRPDRINRFGL